MRIITGTARGHRLFTLKGMHTRPTADRVKEAMFSVLGDLVDDAHVLDAFAGSGALGLEAMSRGAASVWFFDADRAAADICAKNMAALSFENCRLWRGDCLKMLPKLREQGETRTFDLIFADPPYRKGLLNTFCEVVAAGQWLAPDGVLIVETTTKNSDFVLPAAFRIAKSSSYGDTTVHYCKYQHKEEA